MIRLAVAQLLSYVQLDNKYRSFRRHTLDYELTDMRQISQEEFCSSRTCLPSYLVQTHEADIVEVQVAEPWQIS